MSGARWLATVMVLMRLHLHPVRACVTVLGCLGYTVCDPYMLECT